MIILGLGGIHTDPACAILKDGCLASAVEQKKVAPRHPHSDPPMEAIHSALSLAGCTPAEVDIVAIARPFSERHGRHHLHVELRELFPNARVVSVEHHQAHAASAYYASPFDTATVLALDRRGDFRCGSRWNATGTQLTLEKEIAYPDSLGDVYSRVTELLGFRPGAEEHKVQWLSTFASPELAHIFRSILMEGGVSIRIDRKWFDTGRIGKGGFSTRFYQALGLEDGEEIPEPMKALVASGLQSAIERLTLEMAGEGENLCLAGGLALNSLLVASLERSGKWRNVFVQPAAGNSGTALGAAWHAWHVTHGRPERAPLTTLALGPEFEPEEIKKVLENCKLGFRYLLTTDEVIDTAMAQLAADKIVAWMQGRMEFGPRALGNRSILASPLNPYSTENLNVFIKHREPFRKFAASVPASLASRYFETGPNARFLSTVGRVRPEHRATFQPALLGDGLVRVHTVEPEENPLFHQLLMKWGQKTGLPVLYNTSFNLFSDPLVCSPRDAVRSFYSSGIDAMLVGNFVLEK
ncbi:MAG: carbamoyltransferase [Acidobacteria bacterium]|nr:carbamoyltransferase [Acidobacteriota bacterium]